MTGYGVSVVCGSPCDWCYMISWSIPCKWHQPKEFAAWLKKGKKKKVTKWK